MMDMRFEKDETKKATMKEHLLSETVPYFCKKWDTSAGENGGYIAIKKVRCGIDFVLLQMFCMAFLLIRSLFLYQR